MIVVDTTMKKIIDVQSFILRVVECGDAVLLFELVEPVEAVEPVDELKLIPFGQFYIASVHLAGLLITSIDPDILGLFLEFPFINFNASHKIITCPGGISKVLTCVGINAVLVYVYEG